MVAWKHAAQSIADPITVDSITVDPTTAIQPTADEVDRIWLSVWVPRIGHRNGVLDMGSLKRLLYHQHVRNEASSEDFDEAVTNEMALVADEVMADQQRTRDAMKVIAGAAACGDWSAIAAVVEGWMSEHEERNA